MTDDEPIPVQFQIEVPPEVETGVPADFVSVWNTPTSFVLDFVVTKQTPQIIEDGDGAKAAIQALRVSARVRIPPEQVFELASALTRQLTSWEQQTGRAAPPTPMPGFDA